MVSTMTSLVPDNVLIKSHRIAYGIHGQGEPVILIHGTPSFSHIWRNVLPELVSAGYKVHLFDLLGYGYSERPKDPSVDTSVSGQVPVLVGLLDHWQLKQAHIVAHDIGGAVAQRLGIFHQQRVQSLTLIDCVSFDSWPSKRTQEQLEAGLEALISASDADHRQHFSDWLLSAVYHKDRMQSGPLLTYVDMIAGPVGQGSLFQHQIMHYDSKHTSELNDRLTELGNVPVQLIWGANDDWQVIDWANRLHTAIPGSTLHILEECGHFAMEDQPQRIIQLIKNFLQPLIGE